MTNPILFLDVDGVLNCHGYACPVDELLVIDNADRPKTVFIPKGTKEKIYRLRKYFEIVWATGWEGAAHSAFREYLDLPQESWHYIPFYGPKLMSLIKFAGDQPWAWVDDMAAWELQELGWSDHNDWDEDGVHKRPHKYLQDNTMIVCPHGSWGITENQTERLENFGRIWNP